MMLSLKETRASLTEFQRDLLDFICVQFLDSGKHMPARVLFHKFDRTTAEPAIEKLGGRVVWRGYYEGKDAIQATLLGILLSIVSSDAEKLLIDYLKLIRAEYEKDPELSGLQSDDISEKLSLNVQSLRMLGLMVGQAGGKLGLSGGGTNPNGNWYGSISDHADELRNVVDWSQFISQVLLADYDPHFPVSESERLKSEQIGRLSFPNPLQSSPSPEAINEHFASQPKRREHDVRELPDRILQTYSRLWQLETWLRHMVYTELRASLGDEWKSKVKVSKVEGAKNADKALIHMPTPEEDPLSYAQLSELRRIITENRPLFDPFLPPEKIWDAKMDEIAQIRHRVAHFRKGNEHDLERIVHLLRDIDKGIWKFCTSYNTAKSVLPQSSDPVISHFLPLDPLPWVEIEQRKWARVGTIPTDQWFCVTIETTMRPWANWELPVTDRQGFLYDVTLFLRGSRRRHFDYRQIFENTRSLHKHFVHFILDSDASSLRLTIPAVLGEKLIIDVLEKMIETARSSAYPNEWPIHKGTIKEFADEWPEYVLEPHHVLTVLTDDMPCSIFGV